MKQSLLLLFGLLISLISSAQERHTISGYVTDASSGEHLIGATIYDFGRSVGTTTNVYGYYSITLPADSIDFTYSYVGYTPERRAITLDRDVRLDIVLESNTTLGEVVITGEESIQERSEMSTFEMDMQMVDKLPVLLGEKDLLKTIQLLPGVQSGSEGASGIYVRGGGPDQNLFLLDGVPVYNVSHLFGFFSVFNPDGIQNAELIKGGFPAEYGGRLSSVLDIRLKEGDLNELHGEGGIGLIASRLTLEGPINKGRTSFLVSGRRTYIDVLAAPFIAAAGDGERGGYFFYDANMKINHRVDDKNRLFLSGYFGNDKAFARYSDSFGGETEDFKARLAWGNAIVAARWNRVLNPKLFANTTATFTNYRFVTGLDYEYTENGESRTDFYEYRSGIQDLGLKVDLDYLPSPDHFIKFGGAYTFHTFSPGASVLSENEEEQTIGSSQVEAHEFGLFAQDDWKVSDKVKVNGGLRLSGFAVGESFYYGIEPRLNTRYLLSKRVSLKASYARMTQYLHLLTNGSIGLPTDLWVPVTERIEPQRSQQWAAGMATTLTDGYELTIEGYYKEMTDLIEYKEGASFQGTAEDWQGKVEVGDGWSYGAEVLLRKDIGTLTGWIGYTLSWTERQFDNLNFGNKFPYKFDRRHDASLVLTYTPNERVDFGLVWVYGTGNAISLPTAQYVDAPLVPGLDGQFGNVFGSLDHIEERNGYRMPAYHRLDLSVNFHKQMKRHMRTWSFGLYNAYSRQNPFFLFFRDDFQTQSRGLYQISLFPLIPSFTYNFSF